MATSDPDELPFYKRADDQCRPGDIVRLAPSFRALKQLVHIGAEQKAPGRTTAILHGVSDSLPIPAGVLEGKTDARLTVPGLMTWGVLLTRGCDIDHGPVRQLAVIRPLSTMTRVDDQEAVIRGQHTSVHYFPKAHLDGKDFFADSFVDFRFVLTLHRDLFAVLDRPLALTREGLFDLYFSWTRHALGNQLQKTKPCPHCQCAVPVFELASQMLQPPLDY
jgi:hypothetical protein